MAKPRPRANRQKPTAKYQTLVWSPPLRGLAPPIGSIWQLLGGSLKCLRRHGLFFACLLVIFLAGAGFLFWSLGLDPGLAGRQGQLEAIYGSGWLGQLYAAANQLEYLGQQLLASTDFNLYFGIWLILLSLTLISANRQLRRQPPKTVRATVRLAVDSLYFGPGQIVPYCLVLAFLLGQATPALLANAVATDLRAGGLLESNAAQAIALSAVLLVSWLSLYLVSGSVFGLIVASRPGLRPAAAWQTSWDLTTHRRLRVVACLVGGGVVGLLATALVMIPVLWLALAAAPLVFNIWLVLLAFWGHIYFFELYRALLEPPKGRQQ